jgi:hypothetical protein
MIDWESHRQALNKFPSRRTILIKYLNNIAPVGKLVNRYDHKYPAGCPSCPEELETQEHMLQCPCIKRVEWRETFVKEIKETFGRVRHFYSGAATSAPRHTTIVWLSTSDTPKHTSHTPNISHQSGRNRMAPIIEWSTGPRVENNTKSAHARQRNQIQKRPNVEH